MTLEEKEHRNLSQETANCNKEEEKELRLDELLKSHIDDTFYCTIFGDVKLSSIGVSVLGIAPFDGVEVSITPSGKLVSTQFLGNVAPVLFPSREAYLKYPLDAKKAWQKWHDEQKPKRWRAERGGEYFFVDTDCCVWVSEDDYGFLHEKRFKYGNYFESDSLAQQAAEAVRECLMKFH